MGLKYNKNDGQLLSSALKHNLEIADQIVEDVQEGVDHLLSMIDDPFGPLEGQAYHAAATLFQEIVKPTLSKLKEATTAIEGELRTFDYERGNFDLFPDPVYDLDDLKEHLEIKKQQKATVDFQMNLFNNQLANAIAKKAVEDFVYEGQRLQSVANHYEHEIEELEAKKRILEEFSSATASLFQESLHTFQNAMNGAKALKTGSFDSQGNFSMSSNSDLSWYKKITGKDISRDLLHEPSHLTASDIEEQEVANMNAQTKAQLEQIALATGLTLAEVIALYAKASKTMAVKGGDILNNAWEYIKGEYAKATYDVHVSDTDIIKTITTMYFDPSSKTQHGVTIVINETTGEIVSEKGWGTAGEFYAILSKYGSSTPQNLMKRFGDRNSTVSEMQADSKVQSIIGNGFTEIVKNIVRADNINKSTNTTEKIESGKEYQEALKKAEEEMRRKREQQERERHIRDMQNISNGGPGYFAH